MGNFTVRIELIQARWPEDYKDLHTAMFKVGFSNKVIDETDTYEMPPAEYSFIAYGTSQDVLDLAIKTTTPVWSNFRILVTKADEPRKWHNLKKG